MLLMQSSTITAALLLLYLPSSLQTSFSVTATWAHSHHESASLAGTIVHDLGSTTPYATGGPTSRRFIFESGQSGSMDVHGEVLSSTEQAGGRVFARSAVHDALHKPVHKLPGAASQPSSTRRLLTGPGAIAQAGDQHPDARQEPPGASATHEHGVQDKQLDIQRMLLRGRTLFGHGQQLLTAPVGQKEAAQHAAVGQQLQDKSLQRRRSRQMLSTPDGVVGDPSTSVSEATAVREAVPVSDASEDLASSVLSQQHTALSQSLAMVGAGQEMLHALSSEVIMGVRRMLPGGGRGGRRL